MYIQERKRFIDETTEKILAWYQTSPNTKESKMVITNLLVDMLSKMDIVSREELEKDMTLLEENNKELLAHLDEISELKMSYRELEFRVNKDFANQDTDSHFIKSSTFYQYNPNSHEENEDKN